MMQNRRIVLFSLIFSLVTFICTAEGSQDSGAPGGRPPQGQQQSGSQRMERPSDSELTLIRLQYFTENSDSEPTLALSSEQAEIILPVLEEWNIAIESDESAETEVYVDIINEVLTNEQSSYLPQPPMGDRPSGNSNDQKPQQGQERPEGPQRLVVSEILASIIDSLSSMI